MPIAKLTLTIGQCSQEDTAGFNRDSYGVLVPEEPSLTDKGVALGIADGMNESDNGKVASESCMKALFLDYYSTPESWPVKTAVAKVLTALNSWLYSQGHNRYEKTPSLISTFTGVVIKGNTAHIFHVGDTRLYLFRQGSLEQLTRDHRSHTGQHSYLTRAMGADLAIDIDYKTLELQREDILLFLTDGLYEKLSARFLGKMLAKAGDDLDSIAHQLVEAAREAKAESSLTCQIARITNIPEEVPPPAPLQSNPSNGTSPISTAPWRTVAISSVLLNILALGYLLLTRL